MELVTLTSMGTARTFRVGRLDRPGSSDWSGSIAGPARPRLNRGLREAAGVVWAAPGQPSRRFSHLRQTPPIRPNVGLRQQL